MHKSDIFLIICSSFLGGIFFASFFIVNYYLFWIILFAVFGFAIVGLFWKRTGMYFGVIFLLFSFGVCCFEISISNIYNSPMNVFDREEVVVIGEVVRSSDGFDKEKIVVDVFSINNKKGEWGKILVYNDKYSEINYGSLVKIDGVLKIPDNFSNFDYRGYLAKEGVACIISFPKIVVVSTEAGNPILLGIERFKKKISSFIDSEFIPIQSSVVQAMVLGESDKMSNELKGQLSKSGISHAIAISGSHFVLIASFLFEFFLLVGFWKKNSFILVMILISFYIVLISFPASGVRAGIMISCIYLVKILNRNTQQWRVLIFAAFFMCLQNPLVMKFDLGFQLSFLAVSGLVFLSPLLDLFFEKKLLLKNNYLRELFATTIAAQISVLPLLFYTSQSFSLFSFFANILIIPIMPICLALGFSYCLFFWIPFVHSVVSFLLYPFIFFLLMVAKIFSATPFISFGFSSWVMLICYLLLILFVYKNTKKYIF